MAVRVPELYAKLIPSGNPVLGLNVKWFLRYRRSNWCEFGWSHCCEIIVQLSSLNFSLNSQWFYGGISTGSDAVELVGRHLILKDIWIRRAVCYCWYLCACPISLTLADVSYHPTKPFSWQNCSIFIPLLVSTSWPWSHLLAKSTVAICFPLASVSLESKSSFHLVTASKEAGRVTSNTMKAPIASR